MSAIRSRCVANHVIRIRVVDVAVHSLAWCLWYPALQWQLLLLWWWLRAFVPFWLLLQLLRWWLRAFAGSWLLHVCCGCYISDLWRIFRC